MVAVGATGTACIENVEVDPGDLKAAWKADAADKSVVEVSLEAKALAKPGSRELKVQQFGKKLPDAVTLATFAEPAKLDALRVHVGDAEAELDGNGLEQVRSVEVKGESFAPGGEVAGGEATKKTLPLKLPAEAKVGGLKPGRKGAGQGDAGRWPGTGVGDGGSAGQAGADAGAHAGGECGGGGAVDDYARFAG